MIANLRDELVEWERTLVAIDERLHLHLPTRFELRAHEDDTSGACAPRCLELFRERLLSQRIFGGRAGLASSSTGLAPSAMSRTTPSTGTS